MSRACWEVCGWTPMESLAGPWALASYWHLLPVVRSSSWWLLEDERTRLLAVFLTFTEFYLQMQFVCCLTVLLLSA